jgi:hypothetical protein
MAKSALGRGLGHLMKEGATAPPENGSEMPQVTAGMAALLRGGNGGAKGEEGSEDLDRKDAENAAARSRKRKLVQASLVIADVLLIVLVVRLAFVSHGHLGFFEIVLCILALSIGAWLSCLALWMK